MEIKSEKKRAISKKKKMPSHLVALGASAGGAEALQSFFQHMPIDSGAAFVVVQHLPSDFENLLGEVVQNWTEMPVFTVQEGLNPEANTVYIVPPKKNLIMEDNHFFLKEPPKQTFLNHPIDILFNSIADCYGERVVAVILSGTGNDGSLGVIKISECGGLVLVQTPEEAQFDGMPSAAIATNVATCILTTENLPKAIMQYVSNPLSLKKKNVSANENFPKEYKNLFKLLTDTYNVDFHHYKEGTISRRIARRMHVLNLDTLQKYMAYLEATPEELALLYKELLIGVSCFFRDPEAFDILAEQVIPVLFEQKSGMNDDIRIWCPACANGEEAYSLAILFYEYAERRQIPLKIKIFATDISFDFLNSSWRNKYSQESVANVSPERLKRFFIKQDDHYKVSQVLRELVVFSPHDLLASPPFIKMDLISCRNFLIYIQAPTQKRILYSLHSSLNIPGFLFLGASETVGELSLYMDPISSTWKIYEKKIPIPIQTLFNHTGHPMSLTQPIHPLSESLTNSFSIAHHQMPKSTATLPIYVYHALLKEFIPCGFIIDEFHNVLHIFGRAGEFILHQEGPVKLNILSMLSITLKTALTAALQRVEKNKETLTYADVLVENNKGKQVLVTLIIHPIVLNNHVAYYCIGMELSDSEPSTKTSEYFSIDQSSRTIIHTLEQELQQTREILQNSISALETSNEELLASNEELQSTNEELKSVNEVLYTANIEHQKKITELKEANTHIDNLLRSSKIGAVFLDKSLRIRMFTPLVAKFFDLVQDDIGRSIKTFTFHTEFNDIFEKIEWVIATGDSFEVKVKDDQGDGYLLRIIPYLSAEQIIDGAVVTLINM